MLQGPASKRSEQKYKNNIITPKSAIKSSTGINSKRETVTKSTPMKKSTELSGCKKSDNKQQRDLNKVYDEPSPLLL